MANVLVDTAIKGLEALGLPITPSTPYILDLLIQEGEDILTVFPKIVHTIEQLGGSTWQVLEEVAAGFSQYGPTAYVQRTVENHFQPQVNKVKEIQAHKTILIQHHQAALQTIQNHIATLHATSSSTSTTSMAFTSSSTSTTSTAFTGSAATAMITHLTEVSAHFDKLTTIMDESQQIDRDMQTDLQYAVGLIVEMVILDLIIFAVVFIVVFVGSQLILLLPEAFFAPETGTLSFAAGGAVSVGAAAALAGGAVAALLPAEGVIILATLLYVFGRWAIRHAMLEIAHPATSHSYPLISSGTTLPNPGPTPDEVKLANDLFNEFGGAISEQTLQYLVQMLGVSKLSAAMIRCLYQSGYLNLPKSTYNWDNLDVNNSKAWENITGHLDPNDLEGAWKEANPSQVDPSTIPPGSKYVSGADHAQEVNGALNSLDNLIDNLLSRMRYLDNVISHAPDPNAPRIVDMINQKARLQNLKNAFTNLRDFVRSRVAKGSPPPNTWKDQGKLPIVEDLLQTSSCKVPAAKYYK